VYHSSRPEWAKSSQVPITKITTGKWTGDVAQGIKCLRQEQSPEFELLSHQKKKILTHWENKKQK
jgi:hypothetical protein